MKKYYIVTQLFHIFYIGEFETLEDAMRAEKKGRGMATSIMPPLSFIEGDDIEIVMKNFGNGIKDKSKKYTQPFSINQKGLSQPPFLSCSSCGVEFTEGICVDELKYSRTTASEDHYYCPFCEEEGISRYRHFDE